MFISSQNHNADWIVHVAFKYISHGYINLLPSALDFSTQSSIFTTKVISTVRRRKAIIATGNHEAAAWLCWRMRSELRKFLLPWQSRNFILIFNIEMKLLEVSVGYDVN